ncbi:MAG: tetratricopeptide repeat protein, partial [Bacillota bacterium]|nr:tetratricopeptide repeat protein [Bacillota bacterium]
MADQRETARRVRRAWSAVLSGVLGVALALAGLAGAAAAAAEAGPPTLAEVQGLIEAGDYGAARQAYQRLRESGERDWLVEFKLGVLAVEAGRPEEAEEYFRSSLALNPDYGASYYNLALLAYRRNDPAAALAYAEQALPRYRGEGRERVRYDALA